MEIHKIINTKQLIETSTLFEVTANKPKKIAQIRVYTSKTGYSDYYVVAEVFNSTKTEYKATTGRGAYKNAAITEAGDKLGTPKDKERNKDAQMVLSEIAKQNNILNPFIHE